MEVKWIVRLRKHGLLDSYLFLHLFLGFFLLICCFVLGINYDLDMAVYYARYAFLLMDKRVQEKPIQ